MNSAEPTPNLRERTRNYADPELDRNRAEHAKTKRNTHSNRRGPDMERVQNRSKYLVRK